MIQSTLIIRPGLSFTIHQTLHCQNNNTIFSCSLWLILRQLKFDALLCHTVCDWLSVLHCACYREFIAIMFDNTCKIWISFESTVGMSRSWAKAKHCSPYAYSLQMVLCICKCMHLRPSLCRLHALNKFRSARQSKSGMCCAELQVNAAKCEAADSRLQLYVAVRLPVE